MMLATKMRVVEWRRQGKSFEFIGRQVGGVYSDATLCNVAKRKDEWRARAAAGVSGETLPRKTIHSAYVDPRLLSWFLSVRARGRKRVPMLLTVLRCKTLQIEREFGVSGFSA